VEEIGANESLFVSEIGRYKHKLEHKGLFDECDAAVLPVLAEPPRCVQCSLLLLIDASQSVDPGVPVTVDPEHRGLALSTSCPGGVQFLFLTELQ
jgi:hypothetical protein